MYRIVADKGTYKEYIPFTSLWAANLRLKEYRFLTEKEGLSKPVFHIEKAIDPQKGLWEKVA